MVPRGSHSALGGTMALLVALMVLLHCAEAATVRGGGGGLQVQDYEALSMLLEEEEEVKLAQQALLRAQTGFGDPTPRREIEGGVILYYGWDLDKMDPLKLKEALSNVTTLEASVHELGGSAEKVTGVLSGIQEAQAKMKELEEKMTEIHGRHREKLMNLYQAMTRISQFSEQIRAQSDKAIAGGAEKEPALIEIAKIFNSWEQLVGDLKSNRTVIDGTSSEFEAVQEEFLAEKKVLSGIVRSGRDMILAERGLRYTAWTSAFGVDGSLAKFALDSAIVTQEEYDEYMAGRDMEAPKVMDAEDVVSFLKVPPTVTKLSCSNEQTLKGKATKDLPSMELLAWRVVDVDVCYHIQELNEEWLATPDKWGKDPADNEGGKFSDDFLEYFMAMEVKLGLSPSKPKGDCPELSNEEKEMVNEVAVPQDGTALPPAAAAELNKETETKEEADIADIKKDVSEAVVPAPHKHEEEPAGPEPHVAGGDRYNPSVNPVIAGANKMLPERVDTVNSRVTIRDGAGAERVNRPGAPVAAGSGTNTDDKDGEAAAVESAVESAEKDAARKAL